MYILNIHLFLMPLGHFFQEITDQLIQISYRRLKLNVLKTPFFICSLHFDQSAFPSSRNLEVSFTGHL